MHSSSLQILNATPSIAPVLACQNLMDMLARVTPSQIAHYEGNQGMKMAIAEVSLTLTMEVAFNAPKIAQFNRSVQSTAR
jgi:hypothetical protein